MKGEKSKLILIYILIVLVIILIIALTLSILNNKIVECVSGVIVLYNHTNWKKQPTVDELYCVGWLKESYYIGKIKLYVK